jgi:predicted transcriptional regulator
MMTEKEFKESQKECASMLGMSLQQYQEHLRSLKVPKVEKDNIRKYDNSILRKLGIEESMLKRAR